jgi:hypothetical protein
MTRAQQCAPSRDYDWHVDHLTIERTCAAFRLLEGFDDLAGAIQFGR